MVISAIREATGPIEDVAGGPGISPAPTPSGYSSSGTLTKATIKNLHTEKKVEVMFNPTEYSFDKRNSWQPKPTVGGNLAELTFGGGEGMTLTMDLFFDTYEKKQDVRKAYTDEIWKLMMVDEHIKARDSEHGQPPECQFEWGTVWSFKAVIESIRQTFTLFLIDGTPVRSKMTVTFRQCSEEGRYPGQNPTTLSLPGYKARKIKQGETIDWVAYDEYGDATLWRFLADANNLEDPLRLEVGQVLAIPPSP